jgi:phosphoglycolate phosphatase-like HAD superfamily hydrolase
MGKNNDLGLPFDKMRTIDVAFDVDGTLIDTSGFMNIGPVNLLILLRGMKNTRITVWSGGGADYARHHCERMGIDKFVHRYRGKLDTPRWIPDIAIDDIQDTAIGMINLIVREK